MAIVTYFDQLKTAASQFGGDPDAVLLRAFTEAGLPTSTFYRARKGTDLRSDKAKSVAEVLFIWAREGMAHGASGCDAAAAEADVPVHH